MTSEEFEAKVALTTGGVTPCGDQVDWLVSWARTARAALKIARSTEDAYHLHPDRAREFCQLCNAIDAALGPHPA